MRNTMLHVALVAGALAIGAASADAQTRPFTIGISGGPSLPLGDEFNEEFGTGYHVQGSIGFLPGMLPFGVRADVLWQEFPDEHEGVEREVGGLVNGILALPLGVARPYLLGGGGVVRHTPPEEQHGDHAHEAESETTFSFALGGGIEFPFAGLTGALEARYLSLGEGHGALPISVGIRF